MVGRDPAVTNPHSYSTLFETSKPVSRYEVSDQKNGTDLDESANVDGSVTIQQGLLFQRPPTPSLFRFQAFEEPTPRDAESRGGLASRVLRVLRVAGRARGPVS